MTYDQELRNQELIVEERERRIAAANQNATVARIVSIVYFVFGLIELLLLVRVVLRVFGADASNGLANLVYQLSQPFVGLFENLFQNPVINPPNGVLELTTLAAIVAYALIAWVIGQIIWLVLSRPR